MAPDLTPLDFACPRCGGDVAETFYGPCSSCRQELRTGQRGQAHRLVAERFEPAMHVTPNAVALKDD